MNYQKINLSLAQIESASSIPAIEAMNQYMQSLSNDFPLQRFFSIDSIREIVNLDPIFVIRSRNENRFECISGIRAINLLHQYGVTSFEVNEVNETDVLKDIIKFAITRNLLPLIYWPVAYNNNVRCFHLINGLRKCLPTGFREIIPKTQELKHKIGIKNSQGRSSSSNESELEILIASSRKAA